MKTYKILCLCTLFVALVACKEDKKTTPEVKTVETKQVAATHTSEAITADFNDEKLKDVFTQYVALKTAFVNTDAAQASKEASNLMTAFANIGVEDVALQAAQNIVESNDVEVQRSAFVIVTTEVEKMLEGAIAEGVIYKQYCPMAFDNTGAFWLSESKEIRNPYFGDKMLKCGRVASEIK
ncbi:DUF3347 domain-containing protein [Jejudonia soesokkakensis]|uniref:DUF3347 domain-containing protein n=1 Tax=Jejudonia soesokkakensis TaxID=1323432 RepID=A0ABW2MP29_9FLAO